MRYLHNLHTDDAQWEIFPIYKKTCGDNVEILCWDIWNIAPFDICVGSIKITENGYKFVPRSEQIVLPNEVTEWIDDFCQHVTK